MQDVSLMKLTRLRAGNWIEITQLHLLAYFEMCTLRHAVAQLYLVVVRLCPKAPQTLWNTSRFCRLLTAATTLNQMSPVMAYTAMKKMWFDSVGLRSTQLGILCASFKIARALCGREGFGKVNTWHPTFDIWHMTSDIWHNRKRSTLTSLDHRRKLESIRRLQYVTVGFDCFLLFCMRLRQRPRQKTHPW